MSSRLSAVKSLSSLPFADNSTGGALDEGSLEYSQDFDCVKHLEEDRLLEASASKGLFMIKKS